MAEVKILLAGYLEEDNAEGGLRPNITMVRDENLVMIVDPGLLKDQQLLIEKLAEENLTVADVNVVCVTHSHMDHYRNIGMFTRAKALDHWGLWDKDQLTEGIERLTKDIKIIKTPGHSYDGITMLVNTDQGVVAICGDVFWKENFPVDDPYASDKAKLAQSRKKVLELADYVIPGHCC
ncbi:MAG: Metallo-beta-lactamase [Parcubacteria group bacterium GW2011_GWC2_45_7]|nr:MAG: Metallo-beta-lactamase [Parcubacteria group bacterium GW2011_GWC2_45_7]